MMAQWRQWSALYAARAPREKWILAVAGLVLVYALADALWLTPALGRWKNDGKALVQKQADLKRLSEQVALMEAELQAREKQAREALVSGRKDLGAVAEELARFEKTMVPARNMAEFLQGLLPGRGLEVVGLKTLPPQALVARAPAAAAKAAGTPETPQPEAAAGSAPNLYRHGVEIRLAGSFAALLEYLDRLEKSPQKVMFGRLELQSEKYPRSEMTLVLYTLSLDRSWLIV